MGFKVLIPQDVFKEGKQYLSERGYEIKMGSGATVDIIKEEVKDCDAILARTAPFPEEVIRAGKKLKVIARHGVGVNNIDVKTATELGIYVTFAPLSNMNTVAEHTLGLMITIAKHIVRVDKELRGGNFESRNQLTGVDMEGKTLGLIGLGKIGSLVGKKAALGLDMKVIGYDPYLTQDKVIPEIKLVNDWDFIFKNSDFISLHFPVTKETEGIVGEKEFEMMKSTGYVINCARGEIINEAALVEALQAEKIAGAALDVFSPEPPAKDHPLFELDNVIVTPHNAALTRESKARMSLHAAIGIDEVLSGKKPSWPVNEPADK